MEDIKYRIIQLSEISQAIRHQLILPFALHTGHPIGGKFDPLFGSTSDAQAYVENIKREIGASYTSNEIKRPFYGAFMMNVPAIDPSTISWDDVIALRRDEEAWPVPSRSAAPTATAVSGGARGAMMNCDRGFLHSFGV
jgi:hypothetical protein